MHNLTKTLALIFLLAPASGYPLGIGGIKLHSALNQNLNAEIPLVVSAGEKVSDIKVKLASPDKFDQAGVPWSSFLLQIKFTTVASAKGSMVIKLSSNEAVKEPFLDFLLEVIWSKGSLFREFTVLVDPPESYEQATLAVTPSDNNYRPQQEVIPQRQALQRQREGIERSTGGASEYGPTRKNDTLWKIAQRIGKQEGVSVEQAMIAVYKDNPHAFYQDNINALLAGKTLKIPDRKEALKLSRNQAIAELNRQTKAWKSHLSQTIPIETAKTKNASGKQLTLVAPTEAAVSEKVEVAPENEQTASKQTSTAESQVADKEAGASPVDNALQNRVAELEKQLAAIQQIIILKDQQLAAMQSQLQAKPANQAVPNAAETTLPQQKQAQSVATPPVKPEPEAGAFLDPYYLWVGGLGIGALSLLGWAWWRKRQINEEPAMQTSFGVPPSLVKDSTVYDADAAGKSPLLGEVNSADLEASDKDQSEIDPVSEADVYLAYGRYKQAEDLMRDTLKEHPERDECKLKLLEIFYVSKDKRAFESYAGELAEKGKKDDAEFWAKVMEMGREICPDSVLFSSGTDQFDAEKNAIFEKSPVNTTELDEVKTDITLSDIKKADIDLAAFNESFDDEAVKEASGTSGGSLNFDLNSFKDDIIDDDLKKNESIDFDSGGLANEAELDKAHHDVLRKSQEIAGKDEFESFDFNLNVKPGEENEIDEIELSAVSDFVRNYQNIDLSTGKEAGLSNDPLEGDFDLDFDMSIEEQDSELNDMSELETKLDLAMAYIDMNDFDAARDIAREVLEKGTPEQQVTAQTLLDRLK